MEGKRLGSEERAEERVVICVGDIHGHHTKLRSLWSNLRAAIPAAAFDAALVVFLGDYCDRGPDTRLVLDFLLSLPSLHPSQTHVFLCGNHDFAFSAFVGALPPPPDGSPFSATWADHAPNEEMEGWFKGDGYLAMHLQGRRWGGRMRDRFNPKKGMNFKGSIFDAAPTFESYGVPHGSPAIAFCARVTVEFEDALTVEFEDHRLVDSKGGRRRCEVRWSVGNERRARDEGGVVRVINSRSRRGVREEEATVRMMAVGQTPPTFGASPARDGGTQHSVLVEW